MAKLIKFLVKLIIWFVILVVVLLGGLILYNSIGSFDPAEIENLEIVKKEYPANPVKDTLLFANWNIGYGGLGKEIDFFYEGGTQVRPTYDLNKKYISGIRQIMEVLNDADFVLMQEVDVYSKRSYFENQVALLWGDFPGRSMVFSKNYDVRFVPVPPAEPMGKVQSGIFLMSKYLPEKATRYAFPYDEVWPMRLFQLERCYLLAQYQVGEKIITVINTHNSAFDETGKANIIQINMLKEKIVEEYNLGHYVIVGGDWNQNPPGYDINKITTGDVMKTIDPQVPADLLPEGWAWAFDPEIPTNRNVEIPYKKGVTKTTIIDYYVVSPNIEVLDIKTHSTNFEFTDHQPVLLKVVLK